MTMTDPLGDMLTRIRNAQMRRKQYVLTPNSKLRAWVLDVLKSEGYIKSYEIEKNVLVRRLQRVWVRLKKNV